MTEFQVSPSCLSSCVCFLTSYSNSALVPCYLLLSFPLPFRSLLQSFTTLIKRLEAATSRLEDLATSTASAAAVTNNLGRPPVGGQPAPTSYSVPASNNVPDEPEVPLVLAAYDEIMENPLKNFVALSKSIGGLVEDQVRKGKRRIREQDG